MFQYDEESNITQVGFKDFFNCNLKSEFSDIQRFKVQIISDILHIYFYGQI